MCPYKERMQNTINAGIVALVLGAVGIVFSPFDFIGNQGQTPTFSTVCLA